MSGHPVHILSMCVRFGVDGVHTVPTLGVTSLTVTVSPKTNHKGDCVSKLSETSLSSVRSPGTEVLSCTRPFSVSATVSNSTAVRRSHDGTLHPFHDCTLTPGLRPLRTDVYTTPVPQRLGMSTPTERHVGTGFIPLRDLE